ncbi:unnamed protein product [Albugo candida]|uniref:Uncharacterized protein n=1 Tax=Albugo candida TaxID=65357 RepID=A0A024GKQ3_9STRA|nr:unnamed protein product [Albugo candida]|eukprot:CCI47314.1 unnamed protein product [Albugo candida]
MAIKHLIFGLLPFVCNGDSERDLLNKIKGTGSENFFKGVFKRSSNDKANKYAAFAMDYTIVNGSLLLPVLALQVRDFYFAFDHDDVEDVFGFKTAEKKSICVPKQLKYNERESIPLRDIVSGINDIFFKYQPKSKSKSKSKSESRSKLKLKSRSKSKSKSKLNTKLKPKSKTKELLRNDRQKFGAYVGVWQRAVYEFMEDLSRIDECVYLAATVGHRLLYKMALKNQRVLLERVLDNPPKENRMYDFYVDDIVGVQSLPIGLPAVFEEQRALITALVGKSVTPYVISARPKVYSEALVKHFMLAIEPKNVFGSFSKAKEHTEDVDAVILTGNGIAIYDEGKVNKIKAELEGKTPVFVSGVTIGDFKMFDYVLENGGFALIHQFLPSPSQPVYMKYLAQAIENKYGKAKRVHIQHVHQEDATWSA